MGLKMMLKAMGIDFKDADVGRIEALIPRLPEIVVSSLQAIGDMHARQQRIEEKLDAIMTRLERMEDGRHTRTNGRIEHHIG